MCGLLSRVRKQRSADIITRLSIALFAFVTLSLCFTTCAFLTICINLTIKSVFAQLGVITYILQYLLLFGLLFYRLDLVFSGTVFEMSRTLRTMFYTSYFFILVLGVSTAMISDTNDQSSFYSTVGTIVVIGFFISMCVFTVTLIGPFIYKLWITIKSSADNADLIPVVIKTFLLTVPCIVSLVVVAIAIAIKASSGLSSGLLLMEGLFITCDLITNFLSIFLGFKEFDGYYMVICGPCHRMCIKCGHRVTTKSDVGQLAKTVRVMSGSDQGSQDETQTE
eukprot:17624_1